MTRLVTTSLILCLSGQALAEPPDVPPPIKVTVPIECTDGKKVRILPPGYYLSQKTWGHVNTEMVRLQDQETRLLAQRDSLLDDIQTPWKIVAIAFVAGLAGGYAVTKF